MRKLITDEILAEIIARKANGEFLKDLASEYGFYPTAISNRLKRAGIKRDLGINNRFKVNHTFFEVIDTEEKAYFLGLLFADGWITKARNKSPMVGIKLVEEDGYLIEKFRDLIAPNHKVSTKSFPDSNWSTIKYIAVTSVPLVHSLLNFGIQYQKSHSGMIFPKSLSPTLIPHFIRGFFDGDGGIQVRKHDRVEIAFYSTCESFLDDLLETLEFIPYFCKFVDKRESGLDLHEIRLSRQKSVKMLYDFLYKDATIFMKRKKDKFDHLNSW